VKQELGNKAFGNKLYEEAIDLYSKAIEILDSDAVFYSNSIISFILLKYSIFI
jgi:hypothetical protein